MTPNPSAPPIVKPPLGVLPHSLWKELRFRDLARAILRSEEFLCLDRNSDPQQIRSALCNMKDWAKEMVELDIQP